MDFTIWRVMYGNGAAIGIETMLTHSSAHKVFAATHLGRSKVLIKPSRRYLIGSSKGDRSCATRLTAKAIVRVLAEVHLQTQEARTSDFAA